MDYRYNYINLAIKPASKTTSNTYTMMPEI